MDQPESYILVDQPAAMPPVLDAVDGVAEVAIDTEADNLFRFRTRVCLLQLHCAGRTYLIDLLAGLPLDGLWERLRSRHLVMHGSDYDLRLLHDEYGFVASSLFDTMLAAQLLNRPRIGLASLLHEHFGLQLSKEGQKANWSKRPIAEKLLHYAARDVFYLPRLRDLLQGELQRLGRLHWLRQKCDWQIQSALSGFPRADEHGWRIGRSERLSPRQLAVLFEVWHWRQDQAARFDVPPFKVTGNELLLTLAQAAEREDPWSVFGEIRLGKRGPRLQASLEAAFRAGLRRDPATLPRRPRHQPERAPLDAVELERQEKFRACRDEAAKRLDLDPTLIASRSQLAQLAREPDRIDDVLLPWQAELLRHALGPARTPS